MPLISVPCDPCDDCPSVAPDKKYGMALTYALHLGFARPNFLRGLLSYDGPRLDTRRCSRALYRQLQALERRGMFFVDCRINRDGVAVCR
jgi:hypothetical protein